MVPLAAATVATMVDDYASRFARAMKLANMDIRAVADAVGVSYQAVKKVLEGTTKMMAADNNFVAAHVMKVDAEWLARGVGEPRSANAWPLSRELLDAVRGADATAAWKAENAARNVLDMEPLPRQRPEKPLERAA